MTESDTIAGLVTALNAGLDEDEQAAKAASPGPWTVGLARTAEVGELGIFSGGAGVVGSGYEGGGVWDRSDADHIARHDPARELREVAAKRDLIAAILAEPHAYIPGDEFYSCAQAEDPDPAPGEGGPGSGCSDPDRAGGPCDCGRDARAERLLRILAGIYERNDTDD